MWCVFHPEANPPLKAPALHCAHFHGSGWRIDTSSPEADAWFSLSFEPSLNFTHNILPPIYSPSKILLSNFCFQNVGRKIGSFAPWDGLRTLVPRSHDSLPSLSDIKKKFLSESEKYSLQKKDIWFTESWKIHYDIWMEYTSVEWDRRISFPLFFTSQNGFT